MVNGIIARQVDAAALAVDASSLVAPVYLGGSPIWQIDDANWQNLAGKTVVAKSLSDVRENIGFIRPASGAWNKDSSLSMVANYHVNVEQRLPIILIVNKSLPTVSDTKTTGSKTFINGAIEIESPYIVLSSLAVKVEDTAKVKGTDYTAVYSDDGQKVIITAIAEMTTVTVEYNTVTTTALAFSSDTYDEVDYIGQNTGYVPTTIAAPLWDGVTDSSGNKVMDKLAEIAEGVIDKHWFIEAFGNLAASTRAGAITEKANTGSHKMKVCWPFVKVGDYIYPVSLVFSARRQTVDAVNGGIPYESASNEAINIVNLCDASGNTIRQLEEEADSLNAVGIATMAFTTAMGWRTWGVCMGNYSESGKAGIAPNKLNDAAVQMMDYVCNEFERRYGGTVHKPMSMRVVNDILGSFGAFLAGLVSDGMLIAGTISFEASENSTASLADGEFTYTITETNTPPAKAIIGKVSYDSEALGEYFSAIGGE